MTLRVSGKSEDSGPDFANFVGNVPDRARFVSTAARRWISPVSGDKACGC
jgi:hypothetical protein